ncbi:hypothetical protein M3223_12070 [Paenibacillus pasadenensis]|uniref:hypothetical protein n=1 Tax=Paenibacillus pasadenensis TaxID=217090 RepID=UPI00204010DC|nr:hypothetical protein [Paenibacillus pasadenensis]MCM3748090.1 hypothetical protein [Paenibacillus pasadenensis]
MGMDFTAYMSHNFDSAKLLNLCEELNENGSRHAFLSEFINLNASNENQKWSFEPDYIAGTSIINGPCEITLTFSEHVCYFHHYIRWISFLTHQETQQALRGVCFDLMRILNADFVIYVPDNATIESEIMDFLWEDENRDIEYIRNWLKVKCGEPKEKIRDIFKQYEFYWESEGYFVDLFSDF